MRKGRGRGRSRGCGGAGRAGPPPAWATCFGGTLVCAPTGRAGPPAAASTPTAPEVERSSWTRSPAGAGRARPAREPSGQPLQGRAPWWERGALAGGKPGPRRSVWGARNRLGRPRWRLCSPRAPVRVRLGRGVGSGRRDRGCRGGRRPSGPLGMLRLWTAERKEGPSTWRDGLGQSSGVGRSGLSAPSRRSGSAAPFFPDCFSPSLFSRLGRLGPTGGCSVLGRSSGWEVQSEGPLPFVLGETLASVSSSDTWEWKVPPPCRTLPTLYL